MFTLEGVSALLLLIIAFLLRIDETGDIAIQQAQPVQESHVQESHTHTHTHTHTG